MFIATIIACTVGGTDPQPSDCTSLNSPRFFETVEACEFDAINVGVPYVESKGYVVHEIMCTPTKLFETKGDL